VLAHSHHAFPDSAKLGIEPGQVDPGWWLVRVLEWLGLAADVQTPAKVCRRKGLRRVERTFTKPEVSRRNFAVSGFKLRA